MSILNELFEQYGDDATAALAAMANAAPAEWSEFIDSSAEKAYISAHRRWMRRQTVAVDLPELQGEMFPDVTGSIRLRSVVVSTLHGREEHALFDLSGPAGAELLRHAADRDEAPARTVIRRAAAMRHMADLIEATSVEAGRPVSVAEVLELHPPAERTA